MVAIVRSITAIMVVIVSAVPVDSFSSLLSPCPPPRFDVFSENLVRSWWTTTAASTQDDDNTNKKLVVEEVMRSCGGAVQGIREVPLLTTTTNNNNEQKGQQAEGLYLNRANDGFLFLDNGMYTSGPVVIDEQKEQSSSELFLFNFCISEMSRLIVSIDLSSIPTSSNSVGDVRGMLLRTTLGGSGDGDSSKDPAMPEGIIDPISLLQNVEFSRTIHCSMPSIGQSWMLQRAKWEKHVIKDLERQQQQQQIDRTRSAFLGPLQYWVMSQPIADFFEWSGQSSSHPLVVKLEGSSSSHVVVHAGVLCQSSGRVQAIARTYHVNDDHTAAAAGASKSLKSVTFLDGFIPR